MAGTFNKSIEINNESHTSFGVEDIFVTRIKVGEGKELLSNNTLVGLNSGIDIKIHPNPTQGRIKIEVSGIAETVYTINILNSSGVEVEKIVTKELINTIDLEINPKGVYIIQLLINSQLYSQKVILN